MKTSIVRILRALVLLAALVPSAPARAQATTVTVVSPAGTVSQQLPAAGGPFSLDVPLAKNTQNRVTVTATDALGHAATRDVVITQVSLDSVVVSQVTVELLSPEEIEDLVNQGVIDLSDPENYNVSQFTIVLTIDGQPVPVSVPVAVPINEDSGGDAPMPMPDADNAGGNPPPAPREIMILLDEVAGPGLPEPVPLPGVLIIEGRIKSLKEFFAIRLLLLNTSGIFTLSNVTANIAVPAGALSPIMPSTGTVAYGDILPGDGGAPGQSERSFIVRGDRIGTHEVTVNFGGVLTGPGIPEDAPIPFTGRSRTTLQVKGPPTFQVQVFHPDRVVANQPYDLRVDITNTGDMPALYASLDLDVGADGKLVHCRTVPPENTPECEEIRGPETRALGHVDAGRTVSQTFTVRPERGGAITSCVGASDQNITLQVVVGTIGCLAGKYPPADAGAAGPTVSVIPVNNALGVGVHAPVTAFFSTRVDTASITAGDSGSFRVFDRARDVVPGTVRFTETFGRTVAIWQPNDGTTNALRANAEYTVQLTQAVRDFDGHALASAWVSTFTTTGDDVDDVTPPETTLSVRPPVDPNDVIPGQVVLVDAYVVDQGSGVARVEARLKDLDADGATYELIDQKSVFAGDRPPFLFAIDSARLLAARHYQLLVTSYDAMANARDATLSVVVGASGAPPALTLPADPPSSVLQGISLDVTPAVVSDIAKEVRYYLDGAAAPVKTVTIAPFQATIQTLDLALGGHVVRAVVADGFGRTGEDTLAFDLALNRNMPVVAFGSAVDGSVFPAAATFTVQGSASDPIGLRSVLWYVDSVGGRGAAIASGTQPFTVDTAGLADGVHRISGVATNRLGVTNDLADGASWLEFTVVTPSGGTPPDPPVVTHVAVPESGASRVAGTAPAGARVDVTNTRLGVTVSVYVDATGAFVADVEGASGDVLSLVVVDYRVSVTASAAATAVVPAAPLLLGLELAPARLDFTAFGWADVAATAVYDDGSRRDVTASAHWATTAPGVASVGNGRVVAHANGAALVTAEWNGQSASLPVTVAVVVLESISVEPSVVVLTAIGATEALTVIGHSTDGSTAVLGSGNTFSTADARVAAVDAAGVVRAVRRGTTSVTVGHSGTAPVVVPVTVDTSEDLPPTAAIVSPPDARTVERGEYVEVVVSAEDVDGGVTRVSVDASGATTYHDEHQVSPPAPSTTETFGFHVASDAELDGTILVQAFARDTSAQSTPATPVTLRVADRTAPVATVVAPVPDTAFVPGSTVTVTISATDAVGVAEIRYETVGAYRTFDRHAVQPPVLSATTDFTFTIPVEITEGEIFIHGYAKDASGNEGHAAPVRIVVQPDTTPPATRATAIAEPGAAAFADVRFEVTAGREDIEHVELYFRRDGIGTFNRYTDAARGHADGYYPPDAPEILFDSTKTGGDGSYEFFTLGVDASGNREAPPVDGTGATQADVSATFAAGTAWTSVTTPTFLAAGDTSLDGQNVRITNTTLTVDGQHAFHNLDLRGGAVLTHPETSASVAYGIDVSAWTVTIDAASRIDVAARGYLGGGHLDNPDTAGRTRGNVPGSTYRSAGSYGGPGGAFDGTPNPTYGYVTDPADLGSGGSSGACGRGGDGGGRIALDVINVASDGRIDASGEAVAACQPGSGSGGAIKIVAATVSGRGAITANGGAGEVGGGGGRVLVEYTDITTLDTTLVRALGGHGNNATGGNGSVTLRPAGSGAGTLIVDGQGSPSTWSPLGIPPGYVFDDIVLRNQARVLGDDPLVASRALRLETGSILTHSTEFESGLSITAPRVIVDATSSIDVSARGYRGGRRDGNAEFYGLTLNRQPGSTYRSGGSYGGRGGANDGAEGVLYGHPASPVYLGSGGSAGACGAGYNGGGRVTIDASDRVEIQGTLLAEGAGGGGCSPGSGSGGSIRITTSLLLGNGRISADGGVGEVGGGGGRIAITYAHLGPEGANFDGTRSITAQGGHGNIAWGSAGTVLFKGPAQRWGDLVVDEKVNGGTSSSWSTLTRVGYGKITALTPDTLTVDGQVRLLPGGLAGLELAPNIERDTTFTILANTDTTITVDVSAGTRLTDVAAIGDTYAAVYRFDNVSFRRGGHLNLGDRLVVGGTLAVDEYGLLTHYGATLATEPRLDLRAGTIDVRPTGRIDVTGRGYLGGGRGGNDFTGQTFGNVDGSTYRAGGSHGGIGGRHDGTPGAPYGDQTDPDELGAGGSSGACGAGWNGGGRMRLVADHVIVDGALRADGDAGGGCQPGSGAGGSIHVTAGTLSGGGIISASGGGGEVGGGGGRVALLYGSTTFPEANVFAVGGPGNHAVGGNGTVYLKDLHQAFGELVIDGHGAETPDGLSPIPAGATFENLTLRNKARVTADAPLEVRGALRLLGASRLYHTAESEAGLTVHADTMTIDATSAVDVSGLGYPGGRRGSNPEVYGLTLGRVPGPTYRAAGSHGGYGGVYDGAGSPPYGTPFDPRELGAGGSAGACGAGYSGGGLVRITADTSLTVDGAIRADGNGGGGCQPGSGAGGSVRIDTPLIRGTGTISANGGGSEVAGGGGRIRIDYTTWGEPGSDLGATRNITARGGRGSHRDGSAGTVLLVRAGQVYGDLYVDEGLPSGTGSLWSPLTPVGFGRSAALTAETLTLDGALPLVPNGLVGATINPNLAQARTFHVLSNTADTLTVDVADGTLLTDVAHAGDPYAAVWRFDDVVLRGGALVVLDDLLQVDGTLTVDERAVLTHRDATTAWTSRLDVTAQDLVIGADAALDVTGRGYLGGGYAGNGTEGRTLGNVPGSSYRAAGSYGGLGGVREGVPNPVYGSAADPNELGSGGSAGACGRGGDGGGLIRLHAARLALFGTIRADGEGLGGCSPGSGSGGGIRIDVDGALSGSGTIRAAGGGGEVGGGGGRVAVYAGSSTLPAENVTAPGGRGNIAVGEAGTTQTGARQAAKMP